MTSVFAMQVDALFASTSVETFEIAVVALDSIAVRTTFGAVQASVVVFTAHPTITLELVDGAMSESTESRSRSTRMFDTVRQLVRTVFAIGDTITNPILVYAATVSTPEVVGCTVTFPAVLFILTAGTIGVSVALSRSSNANCTVIVGRRTSKLIGQAFVFIC
jgi:hypothetical protein